MSVNCFEKMGTLSGEEMKKLICIPIWNKAKFLKKNCKIYHKLKLLKRKLNQKLNKNLFSEKKLFKESLGSSVTITTIDDEDQFGKLISISSDGYSRSQYDWGSIRVIRIWI